jgi:hypothetical protein
MFVATMMLALAGAMRLYSAMQEDAGEELQSIPVIAGFNSAAAAHNEPRLHEPRRSPDVVDDFWSLPAEK